MKNRENFCLRQRERANRVWQRMSFQRKKGETTSIKGGMWGCWFLGCDIVACEYKIPVCILILVSKNADYRQEENATVSFRYLF